MAQISQKPGAQTDQAVTQILHGIAKFCAPIQLQMASVKVPQNRCCNVHKPQHADASSVARAHAKDEINVLIALSAFTVLGLLVGLSYKYRPVYSLAWTSTDLFTQET